MPFCKNCGRQLAENEICNCTENQNNINTNVNQPPPPPVNPQNFYANPGQPVNVQVVQKKSGAGPIIAIILVVVLLVVLVVGGILAAIFVPAMLGYVKKSKVSSFNASSKTIVNTFNASLQELDERNYGVKGTYIISSENSQSYIIEEDLNGGNFVSTDTIKDTAKGYYSDLDNGEWFVVLENGIATYAAFSDGWHSNYIGTYPYASVKTGPVFYGDSYKTDTRADLKDLYDWAIDRLR